jgi:biopolymer transport protein ExbD
MSKSGSIIRLIDVVLNILFGFMGITDFETKSQILLPSIIGVGTQEIQQQVVYLELKNDTLFEIIDGLNITKELQGIEALERYIDQLNNVYLQNSIQMILVIEPEQETMIQTTVDVMDICEKYQIPKNLSYSQIKLE